MKFAPRLSKSGNNPYWIQMHLTVHWWLDLDGIWNPSSHVQIQMSLSLRSQVSGHLFCCKLSSMTAKQHEVGRKGRQGGTERFPNPNSQLYQHRFCSHSPSCIRRLQSPLSSLCPSSIQISSFPRTETNAVWQFRPVLFIKFETVISLFFLRIPFNLILFLMQINAIMKFCFYDWRIILGSKKSVLIPENL